MYRLLHEESLSFVRTNPVQRVAQTPPSVYSGGFLGVNLYINIETMCNIISAHPKGCYEKKVGRGA